MGVSVSLAMAVVLIPAGATKVRSLSTFREQMADYRLLPYRVTGVLALGVILSELIAAAFLLFSPTRQIGAALATILFGLFLVALVHASVHGYKISCGCFGGSGELDFVGPHTIARTAMLTGLGVAAFVAPTGSWSLLDVCVAFLVLGIVFQVSELARIVSLSRSRFPQAHPFPPTANERVQ